MHNNHHNCLKGRFAVEERRRQVALLLAQAKTELQIASLLNVDQATISRDIKALRELSRQFVFDLAKSDLAFYYRQCIGGIECILKRSWDLIDLGMTVNNEVLVLRLIKDCNEAKFNLFERGPSMMNVKTLEDRLTKIEDNKDRATTTEQQRQISQ